MALFTGSPSTVSVQAPDVRGVWVLDPVHAGPGDVYGELRIVEQPGDAIRLTMVDWGQAWIDGAFRDVVRLTPWTFPLGRWAPRRGAEDGPQPLARARQTGDRLVLAKSTAHGTGDFVWVWRVAHDGCGLLHTETARAWDADFAARPPEGRPLCFQAALSDDSAAEASVASRLRKLEHSGRVAAGIDVRVTADRSALRITCPHQDCRIVRLEAGVRTGTRPLARGTTAQLPVHSEAVIEPVPVPRKPAGSRQ